jgi:SAM-dependent methyltransferase
MAAAGLHEAVHRVFTDFGPGGRALDLGAGEGALGQWLHAAGFEVTCCDLMPELFRAPDLTCLQVDAGKPLPFAEGEFDYVACLEVIEHVEDQFSLVRECARVLRPGGRLVLTTPNLLNLESRVMYLCSGFWPYFRRPVNEFERRPQTDHIHPIGYPQLRYMLRANGFRLRVLTDRYQLTSALLLPLVPLIALATLLRLRRERSPRQRPANWEVLRHLISRPMLLGRVLLIVATKEE